MNPLRNSDLNPEENLLKKEENRASHEIGGFRIHDSLREVRRIADLDQAAFQNELPLIHHIFSDFANQREQFDEMDMSALISLHDKIQQWAGHEEQLLNNIEMITSAVHPSPEAFWKDLALKLEQNPQLTQIEVPGYGTFQRSLLENLIKLQIYPAPQNLFVIDAKCHKLLNNYNNKEELSALQRHLIAGRNDLIAEDLKESDATRLDCYGRSALQWAIILEDVDRIKELLQAGIPLTYDIFQEMATTENLEILTVLHAHAVHAVNAGDPNAVTALLALGANINQEDYNG